MRSRLALYRNLNFARTQAKVVLASSAVSAAALCRIWLNSSVKLIDQCRAMTVQRDSSWYRREARHARYKAEATSDPVLRDSYLQVAEAYDKLADAIAQREPPPC